MSIERVLSWAANQVGAGARAVAVKGLRAGGGPWQLRIDHSGTALEAVLRVGDTSTRQLVVQVDTCESSWRIGPPAPSGTLRGSRLPT
jgi:hypothetical protein